MAFLGQTFVAADMPHGNEGNFSALPAGDYQVSITSADLIPTKAGTGEYIKLRMDVTGPSHQGRVIFANINIRNKSQQAEQIGLQQFGDVIRAIGKKSVQNTDELVGGRMTIKLARVEDKEYGDDQGFRNEVKAYKAISGSAAPAPAAAPMPSAAPAARPAAAGATPPWAK